jgi:hypothetical protein
MAFQLPSKLSPLRELFELDHLAKVGNGEYTTTYAEARMAARRVLEDSRVASVVFIVVMADGYVRLYRFTPSQAPESLWLFGKI